MSIVEKALSKMDKSAQRTAPQRDMPRAAQPPDLEMLPTTSGLGAAAGAIADLLDRPGVRRIDVDIERMRQLGALPPAELQNRILDQFRRIKWPLIAAASSDARQAKSNIIMITSAQPAEGKSFVTMNLAFSMILDRDSSVLIVDSDSAKQDITRLFGLSGSPGLMDYLLDEKLRLEDVVCDTNIEGLKVLPAGKRTPHAPELLGSKRMGNLMEALESGARMRIVLIDSSPLLASNEAQVLASEVDRVLFVVRAEGTSQSHVKDALALLDSTQNVSCVLNQAAASSRDEYYGDYYGQHE